MAIEDFIDMEVVQSMTYVGITVLAIIGLLIGFKMSSLWGNGDIPLLTKILTLSLTPVIAYFVALKFR